jgi:hypothetical protein
VELEKERGGIGDVDKVEIEGLQEQQGIRNRVIMGRIEQVLQGFRVICPVLGKDLLNLILDNLNWFPKLLAHDKLSCIRYFAYRNSQANLLHISNIVALFSIKWIARFPAFEIFRL